jgi:hypothetical protein
VLNPRDGRIVRTWKQDKEWREGRRAAHEASKENRELWCQRAADRVKRAGGRVAEEQSEEAEMSKNAQSKTRGCWAIVMAPERAQRSTKPRTGGRAFTALGGAELGAYRQRFDRLNTTQMVEGNCDY